MILRDLKIFKGIFRNFRRLQGFQFHRTSKDLKDFKGLSKISRSSKEFPMISKDFNRFKLAILTDFKKFYTNSYI